MSKENPTLMVVEDEYLLLQAISKKLKVTGINAIPYPSGSEALAYLKTADVIPDLIWLDYQLKDMEGLEFVNRLKAIEKCAHIPIMIVSNSASEEKVNNMISLGVKQYLLKAKYRLDEIIIIAKKIISEN